MPYDPLSPEGDPFHPPAIPIEVGCLHCGQSYDSYLIEWRIETDADGKPHGFWCCPTPNCGGRGFGCDIFPTDPDYVDEDGNKMWSEDDGEEADEFDDEFEDDLDDEFEAEFGEEPEEPPPSTNGKQQPPEVGEEDIPF
jgi:hypothetical protein